MGGLLLQPPAQDWECPNCTVVDRTTGQDNRWHRCAGLAGITAPMVPAGSGARVRALEREDYVGREAAHVQRDADGRPVMAVVTERPDGSNDVLVNVPTATIAGGAS
jgi:hypothetical protein